MALWSGEGSRGSYSFCIEGCCRGRSAVGGGRGEVETTVQPHCMIGKRERTIVILSSKVVVASTSGVLQCHSVVFVKQNKVFAKAARKPRARAAGPRRPRGGGKSPPSIVTTASAWRGPAWAFDCRRE